MNTYTLSHLYIYPVKSLGGIALSTAKIEARGLEHDRRWLLIDQENQFLTQRNRPQMALINVLLENDSLVFFHQQQPEDRLVVGLHQFEKEVLEVGIWDDTCKANPVGTAADEWFSTKLDIACRLVRMADNEQRLVDSRYAPNGETVSFADGYPFLIIGQTTLDYLNSKLENSVGMDRFRPNFVFLGGLPHEEDEWKNFSINEVGFAGVKPCARCIMTTVNPEKGEIDSKEPLKTLASYRKRENKIYFGQNVLPITFGQVSVGDAIKVSEFHLA